MLKKIKKAKEIKKLNLLIRKAENEQDLAYLEELIEEKRRLMTE